MSGPLGGATQRTQRTETSKTMKSPTVTYTLVIAWSAIAAHRAGAASRARRTVSAAAVAQALRPEPMSRGGSIAASVRTSRNPSKKTSRIACGLNR